VVHLRGSSSAEIDGADQPIQHEEEPLDMLSEDKIMDVLEAFDLTRSYRSAAQLCGVDHHTVRRYVAARDAGLDPTSIGTGERGLLSDPFIEKIEEWVDRSQGRVRADVVHDKLLALGYQGSPRTTRRVVRAVKDSWRRTHARAYQPWIPEPAPCARGQRRCRDAQPAGGRASTSSWCIISRIAPAESSPGSPHSDR
jgi:transposase